MRILFQVIAFFVLFILYVRFQENRALFIPSRTIADTPASIGLKFEDVTLPTEDGLALNAWLVKAAGAKATMIFCHGNAGNIGDRLFKIALFNRLGVNTLIFDYRGYGKSEGKPSEAGIYKDARAAYDFLKKRDDLRSGPVFAYGASLGGAVCIDLATQRELAALIIDSSFSNAADMARRYFPFVPSFLIQTKLDSAAKLKGLHTPVLFFHSADDEVVPYEMGRKLYDAAREPKTFVQLLGTHNEGMIESEKILETEIKRFLERQQIL